MKPQFSSIAIAAQNLPQLRQFYTEAFGWTVLMENPQIIILKLEGALLSICADSLFAEYTGVEPQTGNKSYYFTIGYDDRATLDSDFIALANKGAMVKKSPAQTFWGGYAGFVNDPEGNLWELSSNA